MDAAKTTILIVGHSHIEALRRASEHGVEDADDVAFVFVSLNEPALGDPAADVERPRSFSSVDPTALRRRLREAAPEAAISVLCINGNEHNIFGLLVPQAERGALQREAFVAEVAERYANWIELLARLCPGRLMLLPPPPPLESAERVRASPTLQVIEPIAAPAVRLHLWRWQCDALARAASRHGVRLLRLPKGVFALDGFLAEACCSDDPTHGNTNYGRAVLRAVADQFERTRQAHPYADLPHDAFWDSAVGSVATGELDPVTALPFRIQRDDRIATAGSCFAQHLSARLPGAGLNHFVTEPAGDGDELAYAFSARYGNIYTSRQLLQLFDRAFGFFRPLERAWQRTDKRWCDPYRPRLRADGFATEAEVAADVRKHLAAVRRLFRRLDVLVFTLGLTQCWASKLDGAVFPLAPGVAGGTYDRGNHELLDLTAEQVAADLRAFLDKLAVVNAKARVVLTVSPVPLVATADGRHVLVATTYSKAVLRVAAEQVARSHDRVAYFPSYEIITGAHAGGAYFAADRRSVTPAGVDHVMRVFLARMTQGGAPAGLRSEAFVRGEALAGALCDEEALRRE